MTHMAIQEVKDGKVVDWLEHVSKADDGAWLLNERSTPSFTFVMPALQTQVRCLLSYPLRTLPR